MLDGIAANTLICDANLSEIGLCVTFRARYKFAILPLQPTSQYLLKRVRLGRLSNKKLLVRYLIRRHTNLVESTLQRPLQDVVLRCAHVDVTVVSSGSLRVYRPHPSENFWELE